MFLINKFDIMKKVLLFVLPLLAMCFTSCEKDNGNGNQSFQKIIKEVSCIEEGESTWVITYEYNSKDRPIKCTTFSDGKSTDVTTLEYSANTITEKYQSLENGEESSFIYYLDKNGYIIKCESEHINTTYEYENGYLKKVEYDEGRTENYIVEMEWNNGDIVRKDETEYQYLDKVDKMNIDFMNFSPDAPMQSKFPGMCSKHLRSRYRYTQESAEWDNILYEFDSDGYPIKITGTDIEYNIKYY